MKKLFIILGMSLALLYVGLTIAYNVNQHKPPETHILAAQIVTRPDVRELLIDVNNERVKAGVAPLTLDDKLVASATAKCADMVKYNYHAHYSPAGIRGHSYIIAQYPHYKYLNENLAWDYATSQDTANAWMGSAAHRAAVLDPRYSQVGYAVCHNNWVVQHFVGL